MQSLKPNKDENNNLKVPQTDRFTSSFKEKVQHFIKFRTKEHAQTAKELLNDSKEKYYKRKPCKWVVTLLFMLVGSLLMIIFTKMVTIASNSLYDREAIEQLMRDMIGRKNITEAITDELIVVTYEYNSQQPRLFSKHFA